MEEKLKVQVLESSRRLHELQVSSRSRSVWNVFLVSFLARPFPWSLPCVSLLCLSCLFPVFPTPALLTLCSSCSFLSSLFSLPPLSSLTSVSSLSRLFPPSRPSLPPPRQPPIRNPRTRHEPRRTRRSRPCATGTRSTLRTPHLPTRKLSNTSLLDLARGPLSAKPVGYTRSGCPPMTASPARSQAMDLSVAVAWASVRIGVAR